MVVHSFVEYGNVCWMMPRRGKFPIHVQGILRNSVVLHTTLPY